MGKMMLEKVGAEVMIVEDGEVQSRLLCFGVFQSWGRTSRLLRPNMDGYELTESLRDQGYTIPIIGITESNVGAEAQQ